MEFYNSPVYLYPSGSGEMEIADYFTFLNIKQAL
jgi:hypothetical protein